MVKKSSVWTSLLLGAAGGAAAAVFLATKTGKVVKEKVVDLAKTYKDNPEQLNSDIVNKAQDLSKQATEKFNEVKTQFETGELTVEELVKTGKEKSIETIEQIKEKISEQNFSTTDILEAIKSKTVNAPTVTVDAEDIEDAVVVSEDIELDIAEVITEPVSEVLSESDLETSEKI